MFSSWLMSIVGIALLGVITDLMLPEGQMQKYVKAVFAFLVVFVIISPFPKLLNSNLSIEAFFGKEHALQIQTQFIGVVNMQKKLALEKTIVQGLELHGITNCTAKVNIDYLTNDFKVANILVDVGQVVLTKQLSHIDMIALVRTVTKQLSGIKEEYITIHE